MLKIAKVRDVKTPVRGTRGSAGIDFFVPNDFNHFNCLTIHPHDDALIPSGIKADIPEGYMLMAADKSGVVTSIEAMTRIGMQPKKDSFDGVIIVGAKIVDQDYQGEIHIHVINTGYHSVVIRPGMKIAQFILVPVALDDIEVVDEKELFSESTDRGDGGFGSTNK